MSVYRSEDDSEAVYVTLQGGLVRHSWEDCPKSHSATYNCYVQRQHLTSLHLRTYDTHTYTHTLAHMLIPDDLGRGIEFGVRRRRERLVVVVG